MGKNEKMHSKFHRDQMNGGWFKIGEPISEVRSTGLEGGEFLYNSKKASMGKEQKKTHSKFYRDQMNGTWFQIGGPNA